MSSSPALTGRIGFLALCAAAIAIAFQKFGSVEIEQMAIQVSDVAVAVAALAWLCQAAVARPFRWSSLHVPCALYLASAAHSLIGHPHLRSGVLKTIGIGSLIAVVVIAESMLNRAERWCRLCDVWIAAAAAAAACALLGVAAFYLGWRDNPMVGYWGSLPALAIPRIEGPFRNSNMFADYLGLSLCVWWARRRDYGRYKRLFLALPLFGALPFTFSLQLGAIALAAAILVLLRVPGPTWLRHVVVVGGLAAWLASALLAVVVIVPAGRGDVPAGVVDFKFAGSGRAVAWGASLRTYAQHPIFGKGVGETVAQFEHEYLPPARGTGQLIRFDQDAHNAYIGLLAQMGPVALVSFVWILVLLLRRVTRAPVGVREPLTAGILGVVLFGNFYGSFEDARHLWLFFGICATGAAAVLEARPR
jgi:O-antigen ligase